MERLPCPIDLGTPLIIETLIQLLNHACPRVSERYDVMERVVDIVQKHADKTFEQVRKKPAASDLIIDGTVEHWTKTTYASIRHFGNKMLGEQYFDVKPPQES